MNKKNASLIDSIADISLHRIIFHPLVLMAFITGSMILLGSTAWHQHRDEFIAPKDFEISVAMIKVPRHPSWVPDNWVEIAVRDSQLNDVSLLDIDSAEKVVATLVGQPWVKQILRVEKRRQGFSVDLEYRRSAAMVEIGRNKLVPIDGDGVILDGALFTPEQTQAYMRISIPLPPGSPAIIGQAWPDARIVGCAKLAEYWSEHWQEIGLLRVVNRASPTSATKATDAVGPFELFTRNEIPIIWGSLPGMERTGEATAQQKMDALLEFVKTNGSLDRIPAGIGLDLRSGQVKQLRSSLTRSFESGAETIR